MVDEVGGGGAEAEEEAGLDATRTTAKMMPVRVTASRTLSWTRLRQASIDMGTADLRRGSTIQCLR